MLHLVSPEAGTRSPPLPHPWQPSQLWPGTEVALQKELLIARALEELGEKEIITPHDV